MLCPNCKKTISEEAGGFCKHCGYYQMKSDSVKEEKNKFTKYIIITVILICVAISGYILFENYQTQKNKEATIAERAKENADAEQAVQEAQREADDKLRNLQITELQNQVNTLKNKPPEIIQEPSPATDNTSDIVKEWSPRVAYIECTWVYSDGVVYAKASGSATLINYSDAGMGMATNKHVLLDQGKYPPRDCTVVFPDVKSYPITIGPNMLLISGIEDGGILKITPDTTLDNISKQNIKLCSSVNKGDKLLILGYPAIGSPTGVTATDGIVSGYDGDYYVTSAKIDHGNSGGAAILVKDDCYLGIPSASVVGSIESLGRILKASFVIQQTAK